jgi:hypothetical protein
LFGGASFADAGFFGADDVEERGFGGAGAEGEDSYSGG